MANVTFGGPLRVKSGGLGVDVMDANEPILQQRYRKTTITTAQVLLLNATPIEVLPAVGTTNYMQYNGALLFQDFNATGYTAGAGEDVVIQLGAGGANVSGTVDGTLLDGAADFLVWLPPAIDLTASVVSGVEFLNTNASLEIAIDSGELSVGDSDWDVVVFYTLFPVAGLEALS